MTQDTTAQTFSDLDLPAPVLEAVLSVGYEIPTPIQSRTIPPLLAGRDLLGHAPTGTGKTAAFALPALSRLQPQIRGVQTLVLAPTRELAIQVAEAFARYARQLNDVRVLPIYGGQDYSGQIRQLARGVNIVVGTPGRVMDHMRRGTLKLDNLQSLVLDEADEMLRMGFIDDVEWILEQTPPTRQMALFSATMPSVIRRIANKHLKEPVEINIEGRTTTAATIRQRFWLVSGLHKLDALTRILEAETFDAMIVFVRTRTATVELAEKLVARGFAAAAMNGDMPQKQREQMVEKLKRGQLDILVATDVVARGLDVERISHVINYDIPYDTEAYVHRIGRTGRAGREGDAILFVTQRERRLLGAIERATRQKIEPLQLPTVEMVNNKRVAEFKQRISDTLATGELAWMQRLLEDYSRDHDVPPERVAAALATLYLGDQPLLISEPSAHERRRQRKERVDRRAGNQDNVSAVRARHEFADEDRPRGRAHPADMRAHAHQRSVDSSDSAAATPSDIAASGDTANESTRASRSSRRQAALEADMEMEPFRVEVGAEHGVKPENLVGAIANEAGLDATFIGRIRIADNHSVVELPTGMPRFLLKDLKRVWVCNRQLNMSRLNETRPDGHAGDKRADRPAKAPKAAGKSVAGKPVAEKSVAGKPVAGKPGPRQDRKSAGRSTRGDEPPRRRPGSKGTDDAHKPRKKERHRDRVNKGKQKKR